MKVESDEQMNTEITPPANEPGSFANKDIARSSALFRTFRVDFSLEEIDALTPGELRESTEVGETLLGT